MITPVRIYSTILLSVSFLLLLPLPLSAEMVVVPNATSPKLHVYTSVPSYTNGTTTTPGLAPSDQYAIRLRLIDGTTTSEWYSPFAFKTFSSADPTKSHEENLNFYAVLGGWSNTYVNFEMQPGPGVKVEAEITKLEGTITKAVAHPVQKVQSCTTRDGKAYVIIDNPCQVAIDINGQMDDQDTAVDAKGNKYAGPPIHTVTLFANPMLTSRPQKGDSGVLFIHPGDPVPSTGTWDTLCFGPGVHDIGLNFQISANKSYYIPGDAIVYGSMVNKSDGSNIRIFGYGTLSGKRLTHPRYDKNPDHANLDPGFYNPIHIKGAANTSVTGITIADAVYHSLMLYGDYDPTKPTDVRWVKIFTWIGNGDGINPFRNTLIEDCFIRAQDDSTYVNGRGMKRLVIWNDANGSAFVFSAVPNLTDRTLVVEDCDIIYNRGIFKGEGSRIFNMRGQGRGGGEGVIFRNIRVEDPRPTLQTFYLQMQTSKGAKCTGNLSGVLFQNITVAASSIRGEKDTLMGISTAEISNLTIENYVVEGRPVTSLSSFETNSFVNHIVFRNP